jgi:hypothetical protein
MRFAQDLLRDAAAIRYFRAGELPEPRLTAITDGAIIRVPIPDLDALPQQTLLARVRTFDNEEAWFSARASTVRANLTQGSVDVQRHREVLVEAERISSSASSIFYGGDPVDGEQLIHIAVAILDIASSWTPGVSWARDVYEAVSGRDLFKGDELSSLARSGAILGAISGGIGDKGINAIRTMRRISDLGYSGKRVEQILEAARSLKSRAVWISDHARDAMNNRVISESELKHTIDYGTRFWDVEEKTLVAFEVDFAPGVERVAAAIDIDTRTVTTAYREARSDEELADSLWNAIRRFRRLLGDE